MKTTGKQICILAMPLALCACSSIPAGPGVMVLPGTGKSFEQFRGDDVVCRQFAVFQVGGATPASSAVSSGVSSAVVGSALGAAAGAAIGGGQGAAVGAGIGAAGGGLTGTAMASSSMNSTQDRYDIAYIQCMYAKGHRVPVPGRFSYEDRRDTPMPPPPSSQTPLPPPPPP